MPNKKKSKPSKRARKKKDDNAGVAWIESFAGGGDATTAVSLGALQEKQSRSRRRKQEPLHSEPPDIEDLPKEEKRRVLTAHTLVEGFKQDERLEQAGVKPKRKEKKLSKRARAYARRSILKARIRHKE